MDRELKVEIYIKLPVIREVDPLSGRMVDVIVINDVSFVPKTRVQQNTNHLAVKSRRAIQQRLVHVASDKCPNIEVGSRYVNS